MRQVLHSYQLRLTNLSQGNRALRLLRLSSRRDLDLCQLSGLEGSTAEATLSKVLAGKDQSLLYQLDPRFAPVNQADRRLNQIYRTANLLFEETGSYDLLLGYPFVEGQFLDGTPARCPVLLFPVRLERNLQAKPRWTLRYRRDEPVVFNQTFFLAYEQFQQLRLDPAFWEEEIEPDRDWTTWLQRLYERIKHYQVEVNFNPRLFDQELQPFPDLNTAELSRFRPGVLTFRSHAVLGIFPQSDSALLGDYKQIAEQPDAYDLAPWLGENASPLDASPPSPAYIREEDRYFTTELDQTQEEALLAVKNGRSLVVHGPPGTGKSQVIVNLIADAMAHGRRVLLVSQKRAALDVVHHRLQGLGLGRFAVLVHDYRHDRAAIYAQIKQQIDDLDHFKAELKDLNLTQQNHEFKLLSRRLDQWHRKYEDLYQALTQPQPCGLSPHELYQLLPTGLSPWPLKDEARKLDQAGLAQASERLRALLDYRDLWAEDHPWAQRLSFKGYGVQEKQQLQRLLAHGSAGYTHLRAEYQALSAHLSSRLLEPELNRERIAALRAADRWLQDHQAREDIEALHRAETSGEKALAILAEWEQALRALDERRYLDDEHWQLYEALVRHEEAYRAGQGKALRWLKLDFWRARWFWQKLFKRQEVELDEASFAQLQREVAALRRMHQLYARQHEEPFFESFPLHGPQAAKWEWWQQRQAHATAYAEIRAVAFYRKIKPKFKQGRFEAQRWQQSLGWVDRLERFTDEWQALQEAWRAWLHPVQVERLTAGLSSEADEALGYLTQLQTALQADFEDLRELDRRWAELTPVERELLAKVQRALGPEEGADAVVAQVQQSVQYFWLEGAEQQHPVLSEVSGRGWPREQGSYQAAVATRRKQVTTMIRQQIKERIVGLIRYNRLKNPITYRQIYHQVSKKRRLWSVRKLVAETWRSGLAELTPCWMASPESAAAIFPMEKDFFDLVIFDEASQCRVERALPILLRGKQVVVAGDAQQLQPFDLYQVRYDDPEEAFVENERALEVESILDLAKVSLPPIRLAWHYRSRQDALISFSNHAFYQGRLQALPPAQPDHRYQPALEWVPVQGRWQDNQNRPEAARILDLVLRLVSQPEPPTLGIVTFNYRQQQLIGDLLDERLEYLARQGDPRYEYLQAALHRRDEEEWQGLFIKNIENVQGDERDVILFSVGYARDAEGRLAARFGLLNQAGGENRLNVAITRARRKIYVLCSFLPHELKVEQARHAGPRYLRDYLAYVKAVSEGELGVARSLLAGQPGSDLSQRSANAIAEALAVRLRAEGYKVEQHLGTTGYRLDLAVRQADPARGYALGIEVEGSYYFSGESSKEREVYRPRLWQQLGWPLYRVWARNWWRDPEREVQRIVAMLGRSMDRG
mgnify:CR=1 FL=1